MANESKLRKIFWTVFFLTITFILFVVLVVLSADKVNKTTTSNEYCFSCHVHPHAKQSWRKSEHFTNRTGVIVNCVDCHLPPRQGAFYYKEKIKAGIRDAWAMQFKDVENIDWKAKRSIHHASKIVYDASCVSCHQNIFPIGLNEKGIKAHLHYQKKSETLNCTNCHLTVGHKHPANNVTNNRSKKNEDVFTEPTTVSSFKNYSEKIPGTSVSFDMVAIPEGTFMMGSNEDEQFRKEDEGPQRKVHLKKFFMSKTEVSWDEYWAFYNETKTNDRANFNLKGNIEEVDAISGPTPPYGNPDQGWGQGKQPAISMSWHAANVYCEWLSAKTGKKYRLPTEAEWEYACRGGTQMPYFFEGSPKSFSGLGFWKNIFSPDTAVINSFVAYKMNSERPQLPHTKKENPFGLVNMLGNVAEFCSDFYRKTAYGESDEIVYNPVGPNKGEERVVRGGSFRNDASDLRSAARSHTKTKLWLQSDPQYPKSIWWYSDCYHVGFRIVCEY